MVDEVFITEFYLITFSTLTFIILASVWLFYLLNTDLFLQFGLSFYRSITGMRVKYVPRKYGEGIWCYGEKGRKSRKYPTLLFIHGFGGCKDDWPVIIKRIPSSYHCIIVDLPGHGDTTYLHGVDEPTVSGFADSLKEFLEVTHLDKENQIYLIGCSFGGAIAAFFTHKYPEYVRLLALLCPAILTPIVTDSCQDILNGKYDVLIPKNGHEFTSTINLLCFKTVRVPHKIMQAFVNINFNKRKQLLEKVLYNLVNIDLPKFENDLKHKFNSLKTRTLILWGKHDAMLHVSGANYLRENIPYSQMKIMEECGHVMQLDQPKRTTQYILEFFKSNVF